MADRDELIKLVTQKVVNYIETPHVQRKQERQAAKAAREPWLTKWFGMAPIGIALWWRRRRDKYAKADEA